MSTSAELISLIGRILSVTFFVFSGMNHLRSPQQGQSSTGC